MKRILAGALSLFSALTFGATLTPIQLLNPAGSTAGQVVSSTGSASAPVWGGVTLSAVTGTLAVNHGGTGVSSASGTALDNITGFASTGFLTRTGAGTYAFQSTTNGITLGNLAQAAANTVLANGTGSTANVTAFSMPSCSASGNSINWTSGTGFTCATGYALLASPTFTGTVTTAALTASGVVNMTNATTSSGSTSGALVVTGGVGVGNNVFVAGSVVAGGGFTGALSGTTVSASSTITPSQTAGIVGTTTNNNANAGSVGEYISSTIAQGSPVSVTTATATTITSISLTAGDWDVSANITTAPAGSTTQTLTQVSISTTTNAHGATSTGASNVFPAVAGSGVSTSAVVGPFRMSLSGTTTVFLVGSSVFATSTNAIFGTIRARRVR